MAYIVAQPCIGIKDHACVDVCPVECFYEGEDQLFINPDECIDCGACVPECPVEAIYPDTELPADWASFTAKNSDVFKRNPDLPKAVNKAKWETEKEQSGSFAHGYYEKYKK